MSDEPYQVPLHARLPFESLEGYPVGLHAAVERGTFDSSTSLEGAGNCPSLRAWDEHSLIVRVLRARRMVWLFPAPFYFTRNGLEFSPEAVVTVRRTRPFFPPIGTVVVMLLL